MVGGARRRLKINVFIAPKKPDDVRSFDRDRVIYRRRDDAAEFRRHSAVTSRFTEQR